MLEIRNLCKKYDDKIIFDKLNLKLPSKGLYVIIGKSGCGKSTLLNILSCVDSDYKGEIFFNNQSLRFINRASKQISIVYQNYNLFEDYKVIDNIKIASLIQGKSFDMGNDILKYLKIDKKMLNKKCGMLSGGEKQRIALLRALVNEPLLLLADEPTGSLDSKNGKKVMEVLKEYSKTKLVIVVTHNIELAKIYGDLVIDFDHLNNVNIGDENKLIIQDEKKDKSMFLIIKCHLLNNKMRYLLAFFTFFFSFTFSFVGLSILTSFENIKDAISCNYNDKNVFYLSKVKKEEISNSFFSYSQYLRPSINEILSMRKIMPKFNYYYDLSFFYESNIKINNIDVLFLPVFNLDDNKIIINKELAEKLNYPSNISLQFFKTFIYNDSQYSFEITHDFIVSEVNEEANIFNTPKIYYSYFLSYETLSKYHLLDQKKTSLLKIIKEAKANSEFSNYQMILTFDENDLKEVYKIIKNKIHGYELSSNGYALEATIKEVQHAASLVFGLFEGVLLTSCIAIVLYIVFSLMYDYQKEKAIMISLGKNKFFTLYLLEILSVLAFAIVFSALVIKIVVEIVNKILIKNYLYVELFSPLAFIICLILFVGIVFIISSISYRKLKKVNLIQYLRED